jgi:hypothetical protein
MGGQYKLGSYEGLDWIQLAKNRAAVGCYERCSINSWGFLDQLSNYPIFKEDSAPYCDLKRMEFVLM